MIRHTATNKVMSVLSMTGKDWNRPYEKWDDLFRRDRRAKKELAELEAQILKGDYANLESASLRLEKFSHLGDKDSNIAMLELKQIASCSEVNKTRYEANRKRVLENLQQLPNAVSFTGKLGGRMMVNHAEGILENAGLALHPWFSFPVIPGSAMKGVARHHAWQAWRQAMLDGDTAEAEHLARTMARVFGFPSGDQKPKEQLTETNRVYLDDYGKKLELETASGSVDFIQALPADDDWKLVVDIVNPHGGNDYTDPVPSFFVAVEKGASFTFVLKSNNLAQEGDMEFAKKHLQEGLSESGIGAKTAAGYGWFDFNDSIKKDAAIANLKLVSPAFLGGADWQRQEDTNLRVPSLRGMLRWWWKTLYRSFLDDKELKKLETAVWGSDQNGSQISLQIIKASKQELMPFNVKDRFNLRQDVARAWGIDPQNNGLLYMAYGMAEKEPVRTCILPGAEWTLMISTRNHVSNSPLKGYDYISSECLKEQALLALSLLCQYGGIGSKSRHGFGSLSWDGAWDLQTCREKANVFLQKVYPNVRLVERAKAYSWDTAIKVSIEMPLSNAWTAIDQLGLRVKGFASSYKHHEEKAVLGLPRKIHGPMQYPLNHQRGRWHQPPQNLKLLGDLNNKSRFASPVWYHLDYKDNAHIVINMTAFPSALARSEATSCQMLAQLLNTVKSELEKVAPVKTSGAVPVASPARQQAPVPEVRAGARVKVVLLEEKTKKGGWKVRHSVLGVGSIQNSQDVPSDKKAGDETEVIVAIAKTDGTAQFKWPKT